MSLSSIYVNILDSEIKENYQNLIYKKNTFWCLSSGSNVT